MLNSYKIHLYYGDGKGKTTAATGLAVRRLGSGMKVVYCQFLKDGQSGEINILKNLPGVDLLCVQQNFGFTWTMTPRQKAQAQQAYTDMFIAAADRAKNADMLVLDEVVDAVTTGLLDKDVLLNNINILKDNTEIIMTGHNPPRFFMEISDYVSCIEKVKHPFDENLPARKGIEF